MGKEENCGLFGYCGNKPSYPFLRTGGFNLQHRGQEYCGMATSDGQSINWQQAFSGLVKQNFPRKDRLERFKGEMGIIHVSLKEPQPFLVEKSRLGQFAIAFSGNIINQQELEEKYDILSSFSPSTEILARIIRKSQNFVKGIERISREVKGGWVITVLVPKGIFAARDIYGFRPFVLGKSIVGCAVASESAALVKVGMEIIRDVKPGEIVLLEKNGFRTIERLESKREAYCAFEWGYTARVSSILEGIPVKRARMNMGAKLAENDDIEADIVAAVPLSGIGHALGYAHQSGIPYDEVWEYNRYSDRSYSQSNQNKRDEVAEEKLSEITETIKGKIIVLVDDSIVRGTQIRKLIFKLVEKGAREVHLRIACPPLIAPCQYNISTRTQKELIAASHSIEEIRKMIGATTLKYNTIEAFVEAIGLPKEKLCLACFTSKYPQK